MKFQPGDKVKFLNEKGGGIVTKIIDSATVEVAIEEGFDVPILISNLLKVEGNNSAERLFDVSYNVNPKIEQPETKSRDKEFPRTIAAGALPPGIYFAWHPHNQKMLISGLVDIVLINHTEYDLLYNLFHRTSQGFQGADYGSIGPEATAVIDSAEGESIDKWTDCVIQMMFHKEKIPALIPASEQPFRIKGSKLVKEDNYVETPFLKDKAYVIRIYDLPKPGMEQEQKVIQVTPQKDRALIEKHRIDESSAEVDLHIHSLVDNAFGLSPSQIMSIQLDYLQRALDSAIVANFERVIFIHGVGAGILKIELRKIFEAYDFVEFFDASIAKYGIGATEVIIHGRRGN
jgi:hypothetical protein